MSKSTNTQIRNLVKNAYDLHVHIGPEIIPRKYQTVDALVADESGNIAGMALKNHFYLTQPFIAQTQDSKDIALFGGVVLNTFQGGLNPEAIYANSLLSKESTIVWLPTVSAEQFLDCSSCQIAAEWTSDPQFASRDSTKTPRVAIDKKIMQVLKMIKKTDAVLATGHVSFDEALSVIKKASALGITKIIATHPIYQKIKMPMRVQKAICALGGKIEHCFSMYSIDNIPIIEIAKQIKLVGAQNCILSSDVGQTFSKSPSQSLYEFASLLLNEGITIKELEQMLVENPRHLMRKSTK